MEELDLVVFDTDGARRATVLQELGRHLGEHHRWAAGGTFRQLFVSLSDAAGRVRGGLLGSTHGGWLEVEFVWVAEPLRRRGLGTRLLAAAEDEAVARGCRRAYLDTAGSPAAGFFRGRGFSVCGELPDYRDGNPRYWLLKTLGSSSEA